MKKLGNYKNREESLGAGEVLEIFLPAQDSCMWLNQDVVVIDRYVGRYFMHVKHAQCTACILN